MPPVVAAVGSVVGGLSAANAATGGALGNFASSLLGPKAKAPSGLSMGGVSGQISEEQRKRQQAAYQNLLGQSGQDVPEFVKAREDLATGGTEAQQQLAGAQNVSMAQQGVRGGQAALLKQRGQGELAANLNKQMNELAMQEALRKRKEKLSALTLNPDLGVQ